MLVGLPIVTSLLAALSDESEVDLVELLQRAILLKKPTLFSWPICGPSDIESHRAIIDFAKFASVDEEIPLEVYRWRLLAFRTMVQAHCEVHENDELSMAHDHLPIEEQKIKFTLRARLGDYSGSQNTDPFDRAILEGGLRCLEMGLLGGVDVEVVFEAERGFEFNEDDFLIQGFLVADEDPMRRITCRLRMEKKTFVFERLVRGSDRMDAYERMSSDYSREHWKNFCQSKLSEISRSVDKMDAQESIHYVVFDRFLSTTNEPAPGDPVNPQKTWATKSMKEVLSLQTSVLEQYTKVKKAMTEWLDQQIDAYLESHPEEP